MKRCSLNLQSFHLIKAENVQTSIDVIDEHGKAVGAPKGLFSLNAFHSWRRISSNSSFVAKTFKLPPKNES